MDIAERISRYYAIDPISHTDFSIPCPECGKERRHFQISTVRPVAHCFKCGFRTSWAGLISRIEGIPYEVAKSLIQGYDLRDLDVRPTKELEEIELPPRSDWTRVSRRYLEERGLEQRTIDHFGLYYCATGYFRGRIIIPVRFQGKVVSFQARSIRNDQKRYLFPKGAPRGETLFCYDDTQRYSRLVLVEGPFDAMAVWQAGYQPLAAFGKALTERQCELIRELQPSHLTLFFDADADIHDCYTQLRTCAGLSIAPLIDGDPADCSDIPRALENTISSPVDLVYFHMEALKGRNEHETLQGDR